MRRAHPWLFWSSLLLLAFGVGCKPAGCIAGALGDVTGESGDVHCDRRFVDDGYQAAAFCQEVIDTVATSQFKDDCRNKFHAAAGDGRCGRDFVIAGCETDKINDDNSRVYDWYYDVSGLELAADGGEDAGGPDGGPLFEDPPHTKDDIRATCADPTRYDEGATYQDP